MYKLRNFIAKSNPGYWVFCISEEDILHLVSPRGPRGGGFLPNFPKSRRLHFLQTFLCILIQHKREKGWQQVA